MRLGIGLLASAAFALAACSDDGSARLAVEWGCGPIDGLGAIRGAGTPDWLLVGELTETRETPAAVADIACNLATDQRPLFVGLTEYLGGATDAEEQMLARLDAMIANGAPLIVGRISYEDHPYTGSSEYMTAKARAQALMAKVSAAGAERAVLLLARANAMAQSLPRANDRFSGYAPMPTYLEDAVISLEVAGAPGVGLSGPAIRMHPGMQGGFHGELVLNHMTRPMIAPAWPTDQEIAQARVQEDALDAARREQLAKEIQHDAQAQARQLLENDPAATLSPRDPALTQQQDLPQDKAQ